MTREMRYEECAICGDRTGKAGQGDGSLFCETCEKGPLCEECHGKHEAEHQTNDCVAGEQKP